MLQATTEYYEDGSAPGMVLNVEDVGFASETGSSDLDLLLQSDLKETAESAAELFAAQRAARETFFKFVFNHAAWKHMRLEKIDLSGAAHNADNDSRRYHGFIRRAFAMALEDGKISECDLPARDEIYEYYWLFTYQREWIIAEESKSESCNADERHRPAKRGHAKALKAVVKDCTSTVDRIDRFRQMQENITGVDSGSELTAKMVSRIGKMLVEKRDPYQTEIRREWRDMRLHPPQQQKAETALNNLQRLLNRKDLPDDVAAAIRKAAAVFTDNRHLLLVVDGRGMVTGMLSRTRHYYGWFENYRTGGRGKRGGRNSASMPVHVFKNLNQWKVINCDREFVNGILPFVDLVRQAEDWTAFKRESSCVPPPAEDDNCYLDRLILLPNGTQALDRVEAAAQLDVELTLRPVLLQTIKKWIAHGESFMGRHWEDVVDEVYDVIDVNAEVEVVVEEVPEQPAPNLTKAQQLLEKAKARHAAAMKRWEEVKPA